MLKIRFSINKLVQSAKKLFLKRNHLVAFTLLLIFFIKLISLLSSEFPLSIITSGQIASFNGTYYELYANYNNLGIIEIPIEEFNNKNIFFRIKQENEDLWHYTNVLQISQSERIKEWYPLGFPPMSDSGNKKIIIDITTDTHFQNELPEQIMVKTKYKINFQENNLLQNVTLFTAKLVTFILRNLTDLFITSFILILSYWFLGNIKNHSLIFILFIPLIVKNIILLPVLSLYYYFYVKENIIARANCSTTKYISKDYLLIFLVLLIYILLRITSIHSAFMDDDSISVLAAEGIAKHADSAFLATGFKYYRANLFHFLLSLPISIWGISNVAIHSYILFFSCLNFLLLFLISRKYLTVLESSFPLFVYTLSNWAKEFSTWPRMYEILNFSFLLYIYLLEKFQKTKKPIFYYTAGVISIISIFIHAIGLLLPVSYVVFTLIFFKKAWLYQLKKATLLFFALGAILFILFLLIFLNVNLTQVLFPSLYPFEFWLEEYSFLIVTFFASLPIWLFEYLRNKHISLHAILLFFGLLLFSGIVYTQMPERYRYMYPLLPLFILNVFILIKRLSTHFQLTPLAPFIMFLSTSMIFFTNSNISLSPYVGYEYAPFNLIKESYQAGDEILGQTPQTVLTNTGKVTGWLTSDMNDILAYDNHDNATNRFTNAAVVDFKRLQEMEREGKQIYIVFPSYRRKFLSQELLNHIAMNYYYYPAYSHLAEKNNLGYNDITGVELFSYKKITTQTTSCKVSALPQLPAIYEPQCLNYE